MAPTEELKPTLDVLFVTFNSRDFLPLAVDSLTSLRNTFDVRVGVHDNSGDQALLETVTSQCKLAGLPIFTQKCERNCGFAAACNEMVTESQSDYLLFLNPDAQIVSWPNGWVPSIGIWGPQIVDAHGKKACVYGVRRDPFDEFSFLLTRRQPKPIGRGYVSGACLLIDRSSFKRLNGFDSGYFMYYEDIDLCLRAGSKNIPVILNPLWVVGHVGAASSNQVKDRMILVSAVSSVRFHRKHGHAWRVYAAGMTAYFAFRSLGLPRRGKSQSMRLWARTYFRLARNGEPPAASQPAGIHSTSTQGSGE